MALPCATQNEVSGDEAEYLVKAGVRIVAEGSNMVSDLYVVQSSVFLTTFNKGCTAEAIQVFESSRRQGGGSVWYAPGSKCSEDDGF